jgi:hypothetical protein
MSEPENFVSRWLRIKQESSASAQPDPAELSPEPPPETDLSAPAPFDPACLPPIESITGESDIRPFLQSNVPAELMRAALRTAWVADPAIRDFIGIAECQWDFNDPTAMPGFGPLEATDSAESLAARTVSRLENASDAIARGPDFQGQSMAEAINAPRDRHADKVWRSSGMEEANPPIAERSCRTPEESRVDLDIRPEPHAGMDQSPGNRRRHGSALPKSV